MTTSQCLDHTFAASVPHVFAFREDPRRLLLQFESVHYIVSATFIDTVIHTGPGLNMESPMNYL
jgi:hypothetical protein